MTTKRKVLVNLIIVIYNKIGDDYMEFCIMILKEESLLDSLVKALNKEAVKNITILNSLSVTNEKKHKNDISILGSLRYMLDYYNNEGRVILIPTKEEKVEVIRQVISDLVPNHQYIFFTLKINNVQGKVE